jgi:predicted dehydrogenase
MALNWGVIGAGGIADRRTMPEGIVPAANAELVAIMEPVPEALERVKPKYPEATPYGSLDQILADDRVEAVYIASPPRFHCEQTLAACRAGRHVLCEKPLALTVEEGERMVAAAREAGVKLGTNFMMRFHWCHQRIKRLLDEGKLGRPVMGRAELTCWYPLISGAFRQSQTAGGGGAFVDMGNHCLDLLEFFFGRTTEIAMLTGRLVQEYETEDTAVAVLRFANGATGMIDALFNVPDAASRNMLEVYGSLGSAVTKGTVGQMSTGEISLIAEEAGGGYDAQQQRGGAGEQVLTEASPRNIYRALIEEFTAAVEEGRDPPITGEQGVWNHRVVEAAYESARTGRAVRIP